MAHLLTEIQEPRREKKRNTSLIHNKPVGSTSDQKCAKIHIGSKYIGLGCSAATKVEVAMVEDSHNSQRETFGLKRAIPAAARLRG